MRIKRLTKRHGLVFFEGTIYSSCMAKSFESMIKTVDFSKGYGFRLFRLYCNFWSDIEVSDELTDDIDRIFVAGRLVIFRVLLDGLKEIVG